MYLLPKTVGEELHDSFLTLNSSYLQHHFLVQNAKEQDNLKGRAIACLFTNERLHLFFSSMPQLGLSLVKPLQNEEELFKDWGRGMEAVVRPEDILNDPQQSGNLLGQGRERGSTNNIFFFLTPLPFLSFQFLNCSHFHTYLSLYFYLEKQIVLLFVDGGSFL